MVICRWWLFVELENANGKYNFTFCEGLICWECNVDGSPSYIPRKMALQEIIGSHILWCLARCDIWGLLNLLSKLPIEIQIQYDAQVGHFTLSVRHLCQKWGICTMVKIINHLGFEFGHLVWGNLVPEGCRGEGDDVIWFFKFPSFLGPRSCYHLSEAVLGTCTMV